MAPGRILLFNKPFEKDNGIQSQLFTTVKQTHNVDVTDGSQILAGYNSQRETYQSCL